jgi:electron transfer flavoprotein-quinone oxidoreductase
MRLDDLVKEKVKPYEILDDLLEHPMIAPLVRNGKLIEYGAHLTAEGGIHMVPSTLYAAGMLMVGDAAGFTINSGLVIRGMDLAIGSGLAAAETVIEAKRKKDYSSSSLKLYQSKLEESFIMKDLKLYAKMPEFMESDHLFKKYPLMVNSLFNSIYTQDLTPNEHLYKSALKAIKESDIPLMGLAKDMLKGVRAL